MSYKGFSVSSVLFVMLFLSKTQDACFKVSSFCVSRLQIFTRSLFMLVIYVMSVILDQSHRTAYISFCN